jgi:hypothetical protein
MTGRLRKLYAVVGMIVFLVLLLTVMIASFRAAPMAEPEENRLESRPPERIIA